jgi:hypothetical protein
MARNFCERRIRNANALLARAKGCGATGRAAAVLGHSGGGGNARRGRGGQGFGGREGGVGRQTERFFAAAGRRR